MGGRLFLTADFPLALHLSSRWLVGLALDFLFSFTLRYCFAWFVESLSTVLEKKDNYIRDSA